MMQEECSAHERTFSSGEPANSRGFTLVELLVVTGVLTIVTGIILASNSRFGGVILLENLAYDMALSIRQAQVYGISVRRFGDDNFSLGYGMHFSLSSPTTYNLFGDEDNDGVWDSGEDVPPSPYTIQRGYFVSRLCAPAGADAESCSEVDELDVVFLRPEPDAYIRADGGGLEESARIVVESPRGDIRSVIVEITGQIATE